MIPATTTACVVIPVYRLALDPTEIISLQQCVSVLGSHPIYLAHPKHLDVSPLLLRYPSLRTMAFADDYFTDIKAYNRMMLSDEFYGRFASYEYMLIYQLDAFVFSDQLLHWCAKGYDYIGAPWIPPGRTPNKLGRKIIDARRALYRLFDLYLDCGDHTLDPQFTYSVGNGGFSLRRITAIRSAISALDKQLLKFRDAKIRAWPEDQFFSVAANRYRTRLKIPSADIAAHFSWETNPLNAREMTGGNLPFGCHAWNKLHTEEWTAIFSDAQLNNASAAIRIY